MRSRIKDQHLVILLNKVDLLNEEQIIKLVEEIPLKSGESLLPVSAKTHFNLDRLVEILLEKVNSQNVTESDTIVTNARHYEALRNALEAVRRVGKGLDAEISGDFLSQDIRECLHYLGEITGEITTDEILGNIFRNFCIGK